METGKKSFELKTVVVVLLIVFLAYEILTSKSNVFQYGQEVNTYAKTNAFKVCELVNSKVINVEEDSDNGAVRISFENGAVYYNGVTSDNRRIKVVAKLEVDEEAYSEELVDDYLYELLRSDVYDEIHQDYVDGKLKASYKYNYNNYREVVKFRIKNLPDNRKAITLESTKGQGIPFAEPLEDRLYEDLYD